MENKIKRNRPLNQAKREAIIKAAIEEFYIKGYEGSSMDTVAKEANVSKATVYNHFKNKEELFLALSQILIERFEKSFQYTYCKQKDIKEQLYDIAKKDMDFLSLEENLKLIKIITIVMIQKNQIGLKLLNDSTDYYNVMTIKWFEDAKNDNKLNFDCASFVAKQFIGMLKSFAFLPQLYGAPFLNEEEKEEVIQKAIEMILCLYKNS